MCLSDFILFKQKSAYEMRISDWSSDVCSSDLDRLWHGLVPGDGPYHRRRSAQAEAGTAEPRRHAARLYRADGCHVRRRDDLQFPAKCIAEAILGAGAGLAR